MAYDNASFNDADSGVGVGRGSSGSMANETASTFDGTSSAFIAARMQGPGPDTFTAEAWFKTSTTSGGKIVGFGNSATGTSSSYDRHVYMDNAGHLWFGVYPGSAQTLSTSKTYNDGQWHQVAATLGAGGMQLYVDGVRVGHRSDATSGQSYSGLWRIGGDSLNGWPNQPGNSNFNGTIDDVAIYPSVLTGVQLLKHYTLTGRTSSLPPLPTDSYGKAVNADQPDLYWRLDESAGNTALDSTDSSNDGTYNGGVTKGVPGAIPGYAGTAATFNGSDGFVASNASYSDPLTYSEEAWFKTSTSQGGKIVGFGDNPNGTSSSYDRHVYMQNDGTIVFGVWTGQTNTITTPVSYNDDRWHQVVATQSVDGMKLYVDGALVGTNPQTNAQAYTGYWKVGGDTTWGSSSAYFAGTIDEVAIYSSALSADRVAAHYNLGGPVNVVPVAAFASSGANLNLTFDAGASHDPDGQIVNYAWDFGDGQTGTGASPSHSYSTAGTFQVKLTVTDNRGGVSSVTQPVTSTLPPNQLPTATFTSSTHNLEVSVDGTTSSDSDGTVVSYAWDFGDGHTATGITTDYTYLAAGNYTIKLTVTDDRGGTGTTTKQVTVAPAPNSPPTAAFTSSTTGLSATFDGNGSSDTDGQVVSYAWDFGDGTSLTGTTPTHVYTVAGTFTVTLTVKDNQGATATISHQVIVEPLPNQAPTAAFTYVPNKLAIAFDGTTSSDLDGTVTGYAWDFGDGTSSAGGATTHTYASSGTFTVKLTVTDNGGATGSVSQVLTVTAGPPANIPPTAKFTSIMAGLNGNFDGTTSSDQDGTVASYDWAFGDGGSASTAVASHAFGTAGDYTVTLTVTDNDGATTSVSHVVTATTPVNVPPVAVFTSTVQKLDVAFDGSGSHDPDGQIASYAWAFGDGTTSSGATAHHSYTTPGSYNVTLTVTDNLGGINSITHTVTATSPANLPPTAAFTTAGTALAVNVDGTTSSDPDGNVVSWGWNFGDAGTGSGVSVSHTYAVPGTYTITLTVTDDQGATATTSRSVVVALTPFATDAFSRTVTNGFGTADKGGPWTTSSSASNFTVAGGTGSIKMAGAGSGPSIYLNSVSSSDSDIRVQVGVDKAPTGGGINVSVIGRRVTGQGDYRAKVNLNSNGGVTLGLFRVDNAGAATMVASETVVAGLTYQVGDLLNIRVQVSGNSPSTLKAKVWKDGTVEPGSWMKMGTDSTPGLQASGSIGLFAYLSGSATNAPVMASFKNLWAGPSF
ncbi:hypothetical protein AS189_16540 [Arthrobacter alpinus]|uniref:PKD domain-containing protein n=1 Tax=Arthrobacter alpinus TaxID=656366 RepID=A0A0S2M264_9MICC|nr:hypothetical protein AS189_16540 [Arthrobacter alpinus]